MASLPDLESRLAEYRVKLAKLDVLISSDASNTSLPSLRADLARVIATTEAAIARARAPPSAGAGARAASRFASGARVAVTVMSTIGSAVTAAGVVRGARADGLVDVTFIGTTGPPGKPAIAVAESALALLETPAAAFAAGDLRAGTLVLARYADGSWYPAQVEAVLAGGTEARVRFQGYNNVEVVPREYLQRSDELAGGAAAGGAASGGAAAGGSGADGATGSAGAAAPAMMAAFRVRGRPVVAAANAASGGDDGAEDDNTFADFVVPDVRPSCEG
jgi:hypothetical protein